jgi:hypothetical protein
MKSLSPCSPSARRASLLLALVPGPVETMLLGFSRGARRCVVAVAVIVTLGACSSDRAGDPGRPGSGGAGAASSGGSNATGGGTAAGGSSTTGGGTAAGGSSATGGAAAGGSGGAGGGGNGGLGGGGASGTGGYVGGPISATSACIAYRAAMAKRIFECTGPAGGGTSAPDWGLNCPDDLFSPGSTRTPEAVAACAETWRTFSCDAVNRYGVPACATAGTRAEGEPCAFGTQCASYHCDVSREQPCGTCAPAGPKLGEACLFACHPGSICVAGRCVAGVPPPLPPRVPDGSPCGVYDCLEDSYCDAPESGAMAATCRPVPALGQSCYGTTPCPRGAYCAGSTCAALPRIGELCYVRGGCAEGACLCAEAGCNNGRCTKLLLEGDRCPEAGAQCHPGMECKGGVCVAKASQGLAAACP